MKTVRELLDCLTLESLRRICRRRGLTQVGNKAEVVAGLTLFFGEDSEEFLRALRKDDLHRLLWSAPSNDSRHDLYSKFVLNQTVSIAVLRKVVREKILVKREQEPNNNDSVRWTRNEERALPAVSEKTAEKLVEFLDGSEEHEIRGRVITLPSRTGIEVPSPYDYQDEIVKRLLSERHSGIVHLPTGSGKTRVALEFIAKTLKRDKDAVFLWASYPTALIRQGMVRLTEFSDKLPKNMAFMWLESAGPFRGRGLIGRCKCFFMMRETLTRALRDAANERVTDELSSALKHPLGKRGKQIYLIYDECHQLGADELQKALGVFYTKVLPGRKDRFQAIGLSATPLPTDPEAHSLLQNHVFPPPPGSVKSVKPEWGVHVVEQIENSELEKKGILCPINTVFQGTGTFDIPPLMLDRVMRERRVSAPPQSGKSKELLQYAEQFNRKVMEDGRILSHLAQRIGDNIRLLGKTLVFVPTVDAANRLTDELGGRKGLRGLVSMVHSRLDEMASDGTVKEGASGAELKPYKQIEEFRKRKSTPCVMVNVGMLTTGFDDPKIQTVVLARLTFSTNLFWQMIGRGTRGPEAGGTTECFVIDPIRLTELYDYVGGYRPSLGGHGYGDADRDVFGVGRGGLDPALTSVARVPASAFRGVDVKEGKRMLAAFDEACDEGELSSKDARRIRTILAEFLEGKRLADNELIDLTQFTTLSIEASSDGIVRAVVRPGPSSTGQPQYVEETIRRLEERCGRSLDFLMRRKPTTFDESGLKHWLAQVNFAERKELWTREAFDNAMAAVLYRAS